ncbi:peroxiredoxin [Paenibacillus turpanensis]|uniref:peroxiredoxin n=1 Tax=Paenibacillus turpanensis TaxID=2689078 RepID=UPI00140C1E9F|nr:peroxiredoxin [Paenibacillus turpanensis]
MAKPGDLAPAIEAESTQGTIRLSDYLGQRPIVLIFYPRDFTPVCTAQLCAARDSKAQYAQVDAVVLGVNPGGLEKHSEFSEKYNLDFPLLSDPDGNVRKAFGIGKLLGLFSVQRAVVVIGKD